MKTFRRAWPSRRCVLAPAVLVFVMAGAAIAAPRPNIVFILADDMGYGDAGFNGQAEIRTPNIDRLAKEGCIFTQHYAGAPVCTPSRATLMTGRHTGHVAAHRNGVKVCIQPEETTVAEVLQQAGYATHFIGKWGLGGADLPDDPYRDGYGWKKGKGELYPDHRASIPTQKGFDTSLAYLNQAYAHLYYPTQLWRGDAAEPIPANQHADYAKRTAYSHDLFEAEALKIIQAADGKKPLYLQFSAALPHRETKAPPGPNPYAADVWPPIEKAYAAMVTRLDTTVGHTVEAVDSTPALRGNTLIIFSSDNGAQSSDGHSPFFFNSNGNLRGNKRDLYEGGIRVPTVMRWTGVIPPGSKSDHVSAFWDFLPTAAELAGVSPPEGLDGISMAPTLTGEGEQQEHPYLYWSFHEGQAGPTVGGLFERVPRKALRKEQWKLVVFADEGLELYDLVADPAETTDLAARELHKWIVKDLSALMEDADGT